MGIGKFQPHKVNTPEPIDKKSAHLITSVIGSAALVAPATAGSTNSARTISAHLLTYGEQPSSVVTLERRYGPRLRDDDDDDVFDRLTDKYTYTVRPQKKADYFSAHHHQTATKRSTFWHSDLRDNCGSAFDYVFHLTCIIMVKRFRQVTFWR